jgi:hypothetical protein
MQWTLNDGQNNKQKEGDRMVVGVIQKMEAMGHKNQTETD